ncbi:MAG: hypothetical protein ACT6S0_02895 [Roseateles sp.]|uniref:hypothetical protein n=1 Tax=Roseateles sp. TaxID=1971397 RepID=UPI004035E137
MLLFYGKPNGGNLSKDENASRAARLVALREHFHAWKKWPEFAPANKAFKPVAIHYLQEEIRAGRHKGLKAYGEAAKILVLNAHGNEFAFNNISTGAAEVADLLIELGIREAGTEQIWLAACDNGLQTQDNSGPLPLVSKLASLLATREGLHPKVYAPRGKVSYQDRTLQRVGTEDVIRYGKVMIRTQDGPANPKTGKKTDFFYPFDQGWVLAQ